MNQYQFIVCPLCESQNNSFISEYQNEEKTFLGADTLRKCVACGLIFAWPMPSDKDLDKYYRDNVYYDNKAPYSGEFYNFSYQLAQSRLRLIARHLSLNGIKRWLDVGAGNAVLGYALKEIQPSVIYDAVEPSATIRKGWGDWVSDIFDDVSNTPAETYDVITLNQVLEHVNQPTSFLKSIAKHLVGGGLVYIDVPHRDDIFKPSIETHLLFWEKGSLSSAVERADFDLLFCESVGMKWARARGYFGPSIINKIIDPWRWIVRINWVLVNLGIKMQLNTFARFQADTYGGERQWLRCIAKKLT